MRQACAGRRRERRLVLIAESVEVSSREQEKTLVAWKYRLFRCQKVSFCEKAAFLPTFGQVGEVKSGRCGGGV